MRTEKERTRKRAETGAGLREITITHSPPHPAYLKNEERLASVHPHKFDFVNTSRALCSPPKTQRPRSDHDTMDIVASTTA